MGDDRFKQMFEDKEYAIDTKSDAYRLLKPTEKAKRQNPESDDEAKDSEGEE